MRCKHFQGVVKCAAFPDRIPDAIWLQGNKHTEPFPGDHGIQFEQRQSNDIKPS
jgi:hypothetical protein